MCAAAFVLLGGVTHVMAQGKIAVKHNSRETAADSDEVQSAGGQTATAPASEQTKVEAASYFYEFKQPEFYINHIVIEHDETGRGKISFTRKDSEESLEESFELSPAALARITSLWDALRFIDSDTNYQSAKQFPHLGTMRLRMTRGGRSREVEFNWTDNRDASALVNEYRRAADQSIFVFDIKLARELQPLEAPKLMDRLDTLYSRNGLSDPRQLIPLLRDLSTDERIPLIARNHAGRLLKKIEK